jgi:hypothetical protein
VVHNTITRRAEEEKIIIERKALLSFAPLHVTDMDIHTAQLELS